VTAKSIKAFSLVAVLPTGDASATPIRQSLTPELIRRLSFTHLSELLSFCNS
jgi:hypothetical protein